MTKARSFGSSLAQTSGAKIGGKTWPSGPERARFLPRSWCRGSSTLEILIAFAILTLALTAVILVFSSNQAVAVDTQVSDEALGFAQAQLETARAASRQSFSSLVSAGPVAVVSGPMSYQRQLTVKDLPDGFTKQATSTVSWSSGGQTYSVILSTLLADIVGAAGGTCIPALGSEDWLHPQHYEFHSENLIAPGSGNNSDGLSISDLKVIGQTLYMTAISTSNFKSTFYIFSLSSNPSQMPIYKGSLDNAPSTDDGLNAVAASGHYAYVANSHDSNFQTCTPGANCAQLQVIDVSSSTTPVVKKNFKIPSAAAPFVLGNMTSTGQAVGKSIFYKSGYIYLGLTKTQSGPEFNIIDVHDPLNPAWVGSYAVGRTVSSIFIKDNYAYLGTDDNSRELLVLDITNKASPAPVGLFNVAGSTGFGFGRGMSLVGNTMYFGTSYAGNNAVPEFYVLDNTNPASTHTPPLGSQDIGTNLNPDSINGLAVRENLAFLWTNTAFEIWKINSGTNPYGISSYTTIPMSDFITSGNPSNAAGTSLNCSGHYFYLALVSPQGNNKDIMSVVTPHATNAYTLSNGGTVTVTQGSSVNNTITATLISGSPQNTSFNASGVPANTTTTFTPASCTETCSTQLAIVTTAATPAGTYPITVTGTGGMTTSFNLVVNSAPFDYSLTDNTGGSITIKQTKSSAATITAALIAGTAHPITLTTLGLPAGATASFNNSPCGPTCANTMTINTGTAAKGTYPITVNGTPSDMGPESTSFSLKIN